jgi:transcriptional antiterminator RfaH
MTPQDQGEFSVPPEGQEWVVLHCRPRCEKKVVEVCRREGMHLYLPLRKKTHRYGPRTRVFEVPLFTGYVFGVAAREQKRWLRQNQYIANVLDVCDQKKLVEQLNQIRKALTIGDSVVEVMPYLEKGRSVRVTAGPFRGLEGIVLRFQSKTKVVLNVDMIQQSVAVEVDSAYLVPA